MSVSKLRAAGESARLVMGFSRRCHRTTLRSWAIASAIASPRARSVKLARPAIAAALPSHCTAPDPKASSQRRDSQTVPHLMSATWDPDTAPCHGPARSSSRSPRALLKRSDNSDHRGRPDLLDKRIRCGSPAGGAGKGHVHAEADLLLRLLRGIVDFPPGTALRRPEHRRLPEQGRRRRGSALPTPVRVWSKSSRSASLMSRRLRSASSRMTLSSSVAPTRTRSRPRSRPERPRR